VAGENSTLQQIGDIPPEIEAAFLKPSLYPHAVEEIFCCETHISKVFLTGGYAYKVKKPVNFGFLDFSTLEKRRHFCEREVLLNQRLSHNIYLGVVAVTRKAGGYELDGPGEVVEYAVKMRQLPGERSMLELLRRGELHEGLVAELAVLLANFYRKARHGQSIDKMGTVETVRLNCEENFSQIEPFVSRVVPAEPFLYIRHNVREFLEHRKVLFDRRIAHGHICDGHGDLRLEHVYFLDTVQVIDCIEFNDRFRNNDVTADLAFLGEGLDFYRREDLSHTLVRTYASAANDPEVFVLLDFYKCYRALVRCKVDCLRLAEGGLQQRQRQEVIEKIQRHLDLGKLYAATCSRPTLWLMCGLSGSGKSRIADELAECFQVKVVRSDVIRKKLHGIEPHTGVVTEFGKGIYSEAATESTYDQLLLAARRQLAQGNSCILDATFGKRHQRQRARQVAAEMDACLIAVECLCPEEVRRQRLAQRQGQVLYSDARLQHMAAQGLAFEEVDELPQEVHLRLRTDQSLAESFGELLAEAHWRQRVQARTACSRGGEI